MAIETILKASQHKPFEESIALVSKELALAPVLVAAHVSSPDDIQFQVATDKEGKQWIYIYTSQAELSNAFPAGAQFVEMAFVDALNTIGPDPRFGGMMLNSASAKYPIPRAAFHSVGKALGLI